MSWERGEAREPSRRRRAPVVVAGCVLAIVAVGLVTRQATPTQDAEDIVVREASPSPSPPSPSPRVIQTIRPPSPDPTPSPGEVVREQLGPVLPGSGVTLSVVGHNGLLIQVDLDTGELVEIPLLTAPVEGVELLPDGDGGLFVLDYRYSGTRPQGALRHVGALDLPPAELTPAQQVLRSAHPGRVWVMDTSWPGPHRMREVDRSGTTTAEATLPAGFQASAAVEGGLLVDATGTLVLYDPESGRGRRIAGEGHLLTARADRLARWVCDETFSCWIAVGTVADPDARRVTVASPWRPEGYGAALSPDGRWLATTFYEPVQDSPGESRSRLALVDLETGELREPPGDRSLTGTPPGGSGAALVWAPSGDWLFTATVAGVFAWEVATDRVVPIDVVAGSIAAFAVHPSAG